MLVFLSNGLANLGLLSKYLKKGYIKVLKELFLVSRIIYCCIGGRRSVVFRRIFIRPPIFWTYYTVCYASKSIGTCFMKFRLMTTSPLYPCGKPCSRGTHHETVKNLALFSSIINGITKESRLRISIPWECFQFFNRIENSITFTR